MAYQIIVIGAGPAGLMAAVECGRGGQSVLVLEKNEKVGKKLLASGSGQCNITNSIPQDQFAEQFHDKARFVRKALYSFGPEQLIRRFEEWGVPMDTVAGGKVFPKSRKATDVQKALLKQASAAGVEIRTKEAVLSVEKSGADFLVKTVSGSYSCNHLIIATGGQSYPSLGTSGDGYQWARSLGHNLVPPRPALAPVQIQESPLAELAGVSLRDARVTLWRKNRKLQEFQGDLLITHTGLSGPVILNNSRYIDAKDVLRLNLVKFGNEDAFYKGFTELLQSNGKYMVRKVLDIYDVPRRLLELILSLAEVPQDTRCAEVNKTQRNTLAKLLFAFPLTVYEVGPFEEAMVTAGGVSTLEVNSGTMESRLVPGLYFVGEVLDVDGVTGGYNIQFAFSSAVTAARNILKQQKEQ